MSRYQENPFSFEALDMRPPMLFVSPDDDYAAVFACGQHAVVLESQDGRCIRTRPVRQESARDPYEEAARDFEAKGFVRQPLPGPDLVSFVLEFMQVAGFTPEHVQTSMAICSR